MYQQIMMFKNNSTKFLIIMLCCTFQLMFETSAEIPFSSIFIGVLHELLCIIKKIIFNNSSERCYSRFPIQQVTESDMHRSLCAQWLLPETSLSNIIIIHFTELFSCHFLFWHLPENKGTLSLTIKQRCLPRQPCWEQAITIHH